MVGRGGREGRKGGREGRERYVKWTGGGGGSRKRYQRPPTIIPSIKCIDTNSALERRKKNNPILIIKKNISRIKLSSTTSAPREGVHLTNYTVGGGACHPSAVP